MAFDPVTAAVAERAATALSTLITNAVGALFVRPRRRLRRRTVYDEFEVNIARTRMRVEALAAVHGATLNPLNVPAVLAGWSTVVTVADRTQEALGDLLLHWRCVRRLGVKETSDAADAVLNELSTLMATVDAGWWRPRAHAKFVRDRSAAVARYDAALREFGRCSRADAAATRAERRHARAERYGPLATGG